MKTTTREGTDFPIQSQPSRCGCIYNEILVDIVIVRIGDGISEKVIISICARLEMEE
jgi:hypothetical protein